MGCLSNCPLSKFCFNCLYFIYKLDFRSLVKNLYISSNKVNFLIFFLVTSNNLLKINRAIWYPLKLNINGNDVWSFTSSTPFIFFYGLTLFGKNPEVLVAVLLAPIVSFNTKKEEHFSKNLPWKVCVHRRLWRTRYTLTTVPFKNDSVISWCVYLFWFYNRIVCVLQNLSCLSYKNFRAISGLLYSWGFGFLAICEFLWA